VELRKHDIATRFNPLMATLKPQSNERTIIQQYGDCHTGRWWMGTGLLHLVQRGAWAVPPSFCQ